jgi:thymidylate synthase ThyX
VDYGHASIAGMTGGIAIVIDGCSMFLAYKLFELSQLCDGQESSTRYIKLDKSNLPSVSETGIPPELSAQWQELMELSFEIYHEVYQKLDQAAKQDPSVVRIPSGASPKVEERLRKNYALDRCRYFIPFATRTNVALVMTARVWSETIRQLDSLPLPEARECADGLRRELSRFAPRLTRHCYPDEASRFQAQQVFDYATGKIRNLEYLQVYWRIKFGWRWRTGLQTSCPGFRTLRTLFMEKSPLQHIGYFGEKGYGAGSLE